MFLLTTKFKNARGPARPLKAFFLSPPQKILYFYSHTLLTKKSSVLREIFLLVSSKGENAIFGAFFAFPCRGRQGDFFQKKITLLWGCRGQSPLPYGFLISKSEIGRAHV
jgi:hypothetical protein